jgi:hypothetical protein
MQDSLTLAVTGRRNTFAPSLGRRVLPNLSPAAPVASPSSDANASSNEALSSQVPAPQPAADKIVASDPINLTPAAPGPAILNSTPAQSVTGVIPKGRGTVISSNVSGNGGAAVAAGGVSTASPPVLGTPPAPRSSLQVSFNEPVKPTAAAAVPSAASHPRLTAASPAVIQRAPMRAAVPVPSPGSSVGLTIKALMTDRDVQSRLKRSINADDGDTPVKKRIAAPAPTPSALAPSSHASVQVKIINGRISLDEASLEVSANAGPEPDDAFGQVVENSGLVSCIAGRREYSKAWGIEETDNLHKAVGMFGLDFQTIAVYLGTGRTRKQVLAKFKREEQQNPQRIQESIKNRAGSSSWRELQEEIIRRAQGEMLQPAEEEPANADADADADDDVGEAP